MRKDAQIILESALAAVQPARLIRSWISKEGDSIRIGDLISEKNDRKHLYVVAIGKAAAAMGQEVEKILGDDITDGIVVTKYHHALPLKKLACIEAGHPVPDEHGVKAAASVSNLLGKLSSHDLVLVLLSGGASALLADIHPGINIQEFGDLSDLLLKSGADINELNTVRKHLSVLKGGQFVKSAYPATVVSLVLSDVIGDPPAVIGSGPTVPDPSTFAEAWETLVKYGLDRKAGPAIISHFKKGLSELGLETPKPGDPVFEHSFYYLIGNNNLAVSSAAEKAKSLGYHVDVEKDLVQGEAREQAELWTARAEEYNGPLPACLIAGGETTVTIRGKGRGGRNQEFALAVLNQWKKKIHPGKHKILIMSAATDGTDGPTDAAGAWVDEELVAYVKEKNLNPLAYLENNDAYTFFKQTGCHLITGPTQTNVMDLVIVLISER